jgi:hypothetical protein
MALEITVYTVTCYKKNSHSSPKSDEREEYIFWDITPCSPPKVNRRFGGTYRLYLQGGIISRALLATCFHSGILLGLFFVPENGGDMFLRNVGLL